jgi:hypothetical protein
MSKRRRWTHKPKRKAKKEEPLPISVEAAPIVAVCIPSDDHVHAGFCISLVHMLMHTMLTDAIKLEGITIQHIGASILPYSRYTLVKQALHHNATHLLFIDSDMTFPPDTLVRLMRHDKEIVGINAMSRRPPYNLTAWARPGERIVTLTDSMGLEKIWRTGFAVVLIKAEVFVNPLLKQAEARIQEGLPIEPLPQPVTEVA